MAYNFTNNFDLSASYDSASDSTITLLSAVTDIDFSSDDDTDDNALINEISSRDSFHLYSEKQHGKFYIGIIEYDKKYNCLLLSSSISPNTYFNYSHNDCLKYLYAHSLSYYVRPNMEIIQLYITSDGAYTTIVKTFWIKLIQRKWKKIYKQRKYIIKLRCNSRSIYYRQINGKWPNRLNYLPSIKDIFT